MFEKAEWVAQTNVYEVNLRQYTRQGNFKAFRDHLPRLHEMGVHTLWFMPVTPISSDRRKGSLGSYYACSDYTSVNPEFGTLEEFRDLVEEIHRLDMKVIIDWVANHTGADHTWTLSDPDFFIRNPEGQFYDKHGWDDVIDLDYGNPRMRQEMIRCMQFWIDECDIDGFRCDMAMLVPVDFWRQAREQLELRKKLFWLAECDQWYDQAYLEVFDAAYTWKWMHATQDYRRHHLPIHTLVDTLYGYNDLAPQGAIQAWFTSNHDENSWNGTEYEKYGEMALPLAVFSCTWNGIPLLYSGQELPLRKRLAFFEKDEMEWGEVQLHEFYLKLLSLHRQNPALRAGCTEGETRFVHTDHADKVICYQRRNGHHEVLVMLNFAEWPLDVKIFDTLNPHEYRPLFPLAVIDAGYPARVHLPGWGFGVWYR